MFHRLRDTEIRHVIGRGLRAQQEVTPHVLFDRPVPVVAADDGIREVEISSLTSEQSGTARPLVLGAEHVHGDLRRIRIGWNLVIEEIL